MRAYQEAIGKLPAGGEKRKEEEEGEMKSGYCKADMKEGDFF